MPCHGKEVPKQFPILIFMKQGWYIGLRDPRPSEVLEDDVVEEYFQKFYVEPDWRFREKKYAGMRV